MERMKIEELLNRDMDDREREMMILMLKDQGLKNYHLEYTDEGIKVWTVN